MTRKLTSYVLSLALVGITLSSCGKYEDGPGFTVLTKKMRLTGIWDKTEEVDTDGTVYTDSDDETIEFTKSNTALLKDPTYGTNFSGTWEFISSKEKLRVSIDYPTTTVTDDWNIRRLTNSELWVSDPDGYQYHFKKVK